MQVSPPNALPWLIQCAVKTLLPCHPLLPPYLPNIPPSVDLSFGFGGGEDGAGDVAVDELFGFGGEAFEVVEVDVVAHEHQFDTSAVAPHGHVAGEVSLGYVADPADHLLNEAVDAGVLAQDAGDVVEQRMAAVGAEHLAVLLHPRHQQSALLEAVQLEPYGIGALAEFLGQPAKMAVYFGGEEELGEDFEAGFAGD